jgi:hypothetical protein
MTTAAHIINFYASLKAPRNLPKGVEILHPQADETTMQVVRTFYTKYYSDNRPRQLLFGINPGRFGAGTTGVNFTGPKQLLEFCGIQHPFKPRSELSAEFIYEMITAYGGPDKFYGRFFITSVSPLGFVKNGVNLNYYDDPVLAASLRPWIVQTIKDQLAFTRAGRTCICIGGEKNFRYFSSVNQEHGFFDNILPLPHPRFIMQYRRKQKEAYVAEYLQALTAFGD